ncbi:MAG: hypothetical protein JWL73_620 [Actinomycetia bacterium]|nr:hypothetical protein [Actinomycetes bacterium]
MSATVSVQGISITDPSTAGLGAVSSVASAGPSVAGVHSGDVLAFTGVGAGTLLLTVLGVVSLIIGAFAVVFGKRFARTTDDPNLQDLAHLADSAAFKAGAGV